MRKELHKIARNRGVSQAQVALNWCRAHNSIPIAGLRTPSQAKDAGEALKWNLSRKEKQTLDNLSQECKVNMPNNPFQSD